MKPNCLVPVRLIEFSFDSFVEFGREKLQSHTVAPLTTSCAMRATTSLPSFKSAGETGSMRRATQKARVIR
jgi:hypothetical protein